ncbi:MAG: clan AA aspartic protease [Methyloprofundus sp.]|nr:clan AA aspartic protease [Methyloprofundus sp.]
MKIFFKKQRRYIAPFCLLSLFAFCSSLALADKIVLKNGRNFSGTIKKQTATHITLDIGGGSISLRKSSIESITKNDDSTATQTNRPPTNVLIELDPPNELMDIANRYKKLQKERFSAIQAKKKAQAIKRERAALLKRFAQEKKRYFAAAQRVTHAQPNNNVRAYNNLVHKQNQASNKLKATQNKISLSFKKVSHGEKTISRYQLSLENMQQQVKLRKTADVALENGKQAQLFWAKLDKKLSRLNEEFKHVSIAHDNANDHMILTMRINDRVNGRFLLDTGATYVTLSQAMATRLNLNSSSLYTIPLKIADGSTIRGKVTVLNSMSVSGVQAKQVTAVILPAPPKQGVDGLLGMSFLREFVVNIDSANNKIIFERFEP